MRKIIAVLCILVLLTACVDRKYIEKLGIVTVVGYDLLEEGWLEGTMVLFQFDPNATNISQIIVSRAKTSKGLMQDASLKSSKELVSGQLRLVVYGKEMAEEGVMRVTDTMIRDAAIADMLYLAVSETSANEVMNTNNFEDAPNVGNYLYTLIQKNIQEEKIPQATLHHFVSNVYSDGKDPVLPMIKLENSKATVMNLALFRDEKMVGQITAKEGFFLKLLQGRYQSGHLEIAIPTREIKDYIRHEANQQTREFLYMDLDEIKSQTNIELTNVDTPSFSAKVNLTARILELSENVSLENPEVIKILEEQISKSIEFQMEQLLQKTQKMKSDPFGFGNTYQEKVGQQSVDSKDWHELYPNIEVNFNVQVKVIRHGITD
ncbi:hypothetical protein N781_06520 [Pontibacillus halophilus JSM 076056 = DSM 19796]|uniref:Spore germination protein n=1 Tax=Pontibacillus halophilus JSM 076056 = DSM 19796 TaxID=1385510 RepID=A0A0A5I4K5_9BACI|nr:Ger(x)C family spore germination protein [Pontibacillus halophilus]KGX90757.1 hypothetical protein N781_06520 [Pontibacillus halophilus JSM 076056 = DSM 19796]